jgi:hypothetical protein
VYISNTERAELGLLAWGSDVPEELVMAARARRAGVVLTQASDPPKKGKAKAAAEVEPQAE